MMTESLDAQISELVRRLQQRGELLAVAESCTGGWLAKVCTDRPGSSLWFERGFVTYSNAAKAEMLGVDPALIEDHGAVSREVVVAMADGALGNSRAHWSAAISGVAGPDGGSADKPVGTVWIAWAGPGLAPQAQRFELDGDRDAVRRASVAAAVNGLLARLPEA